MRKIFLLSVLALVSLCLPQAAKAMSYVPDCITSQNAVYNAEENTVTVTGTVPTLTEYDWDTYEQYELPYVSYIMIERHEIGTSWPAEEYARINSPELGSTFEFVDKNISADVNYEYRLSCYVDDLGSRTVYASVYTGVTPGEITDFTLSVADHLASAIDMTIKAPEKSETGAELKNPMSIEIQKYEDWSFTTIHTIENVTPGQVCTWKHADLTMDKKYEYRAIARVGQNGYGRGAVASIFVGLDYPGVPENFKTLSKGESVEISWSAPVVGGRNGCYNPEATTYILSRIYLDGQQEVVATGIKDTFYVDTPDFFEESAVKYELVAQNEAGTSMKGAKSESVIVGKPSALPFKESFENGLLTHMGWTKQTTQDDPYYTYDAWDFIRTGTMFHYPTDEYLSIEAQDGDEGLATCKFYADAKDGQTETLVSPHLAVSGMETVELSFYYWKVISDASNNVVTVAASKNDGEWESLYTSVVPETGVDPQWAEVKLPINLENGTETLRLKIAAIRHDGSIANVFIDNITVKESEQTGVEMLPADNVEGKVEYYNLQGVKVAKPTMSGVYIKRCGKNAEKVIIR